MTETMTAVSVAEAIYKATVKNSGADAKFWFPCLFAEQKIAAYADQRAAEMIKIMVQPQITIITPEAAAQLAVAQSRIAKLEHRLEIDVVHGINGDEAVHPDQRDDLPDGIYCRDCTIKGLEDRLAKVTVERDRLRQTIINLTNAAAIILGNRDGEAGYALLEAEINQVLRPTVPESEEA